MPNLNGVFHYGDSSLEHIILNNIISFMKYGLLEIGAYYNIDKGDLNYNGSNMSRLRPISAPGVGTNTIFQDVKNDWVWEQNINLRFSSGTQPVQISGIYVNDIFFPTGTSVSGKTYYVDYSKGQVVFSTGFTVAPKIEVPRTIRGVHVYEKDSSEIRDIISDWRKFNTASGITSTSYKAYLPCITVEILGYRTVRGMEQGSRAKNVDIQLQFDVWANNSYERGKLVDIINSLETKLVTFYNVDNAPKPLNHRGELVAPSSTWPFLIQNYYLGEGRFNEDFRTNKIQQNLSPTQISRCTISLNTDIYPV